MIRVNLTEQEYETLEASLSRDKRLATFFELNGFPIYSVIIERIELLEMKLQQAKEDFDRK